MRTKGQGWDFWLREDLTPEEMSLKRGCGGVNLLCDSVELIDAHMRCAKEKLAAAAPAEPAPDLENFETEVLH